MSSEGFWGPGVQQRRAEWGFHDYCAGGGAPVGPATMEPCDWWRLAGFVLAQDELKHSLWVHGGNHLVLIPNHIFKCDGKINKIFFVFISFI